MKYFEIEFTLTPCTEDAQDVLAAIAGEAGCESFDPTPTGLRAYIQQPLYDEDALRLALEGFPFDAVHIIYKVREAEYRDWNEQWEQAGFDPIVITDEQPARRDGRAGGIIIHDGIHLPDGNDAPDGSPAAPLTIEIDARMAFGTGTHETTRMVCAELLRLPLEGWRVLDCGCGTGILGICALRLGAAACVGYDIDEWSADNTRHNAVINRVDDRMTILCGDSSVLAHSAATPTTPGTAVPGGAAAGFHLVVANINRNILLQDMPRFVNVMAPGATLILSGFYENDCPQLESRAQSLGLTLHHTRTDGDWACMVFRR